MSLRSCVAPVARRHARLARTDLFPGNVSRLLPALSCAFVETYVVEVERACPPAEGPRAQLRAAAPRRIQWMMLMQQMMQDSKDAGVRLVDEPPRI
jgi:hypothetical protein